MTQGVLNVCRDTSIQVRLQKDELDAIDHYRRKKSDPPTRGKALRELARAALRSSTSSHVKATTGALRARRDNFRNSRKCLAERANAGWAKGQ
jgi:hypothetical protein